MGGCPRTPVIDQLAYEPNGPVQAIATQGPTGLIANLTYSHDGVSNVDTLSDQYGTHDFGYDGLDRLTQVLRPAASGLPDEGYTYDRVGNRLDPGNSGAYAYDGNNRITASPGLTYVFDDDGNLQSRSDGASFTHDARNRLRQFMKNATTTNYLYDQAGRRISKTVNGSTTWFLWSGTVLLAEYDAAGGRVKRYGYLDGDFAPTQVQDPNGTYYVHLDHLQTPRFLTNSSAAIVWRARREAFGTTLSESDPDGDGVAVTCNVGFPGQYYDSETELQYNYFRDYDPATGRYVESDPIGLEGGINAYAYAISNPLNNLDRFGLKCGTGWSDQVISDSPFGIDISDCCQAHDDCYGDCFSSPPKSYCDQQFRACIYSKCAGRTGMSLRACRLIAEGYPWGVDNRFGRDAFRNARRGDPKQFLYGGLTIGAVMSGRR